MSSLFPIPADNGKLMLNVYSIVGGLLFAGHLVIVVLLFDLPGWVGWVAGGAAGPVSSYFYSTYERKAHRARNDAERDRLRVHEEREQGSPSDSAE